LVVLEELEAQAELVELVETAVQAEVVELAVAAEAAVEDTTPLVKESETCLAAEVVAALDLLAVVEEQRAVRAQLLDQPAAQRRAAVAVQVMVLQAQVVLEET
jgi:hypothetical protein